MPVINAGESAFYSCDKLTNIVIPNGVTRIAEMVFLNCDELESVTIPGGVTKIGWHAFGSCNDLTVINYGGTEEQWTAITADKDIGIGENVEIITLRVEPTIEPTAEPTAEPTIEPTATPTAAPDFAFGEILKYHSGDYTVEIEKNISKDVRLILAVYSENGLIAVDSKIMYADEIGRYAEWIGNYRVSDNIKYVKVFAWEDNMLPLCEAKTFLDKDIPYSNMD